MGYSGIPILCHLEIKDTESLGFRLWKPHELSQPQDFSVKPESFEMSEAIYKGSILWKQ